MDNWKDIEDNSKATEQRRADAKEKRKHLKIDLKRLLNTPEGFTLLAVIRHLGGAGRCPVILDSSNKTFYENGRFSLMTEITELFKRADYAGYLKFLDYEESLNKNKG